MLDKNVWQKYYLVNNSPLESINNILFLYLLQSVLYFTALSLINDINDSIFRRI